MAASIITRTYADGDDKVLSLSSDQCRRTLQIGTDWTRIRIGVRYRLNDQGLTPASMVAGSCPFFFGLVSGTTNGYGSITTNNSYGVRPVINVTWNRLTTGPTVYQLASTATLQSVSRVGSTATGQTATGAYFTLTTAQRIALYIDITRNPGGSWPITNMFPKGSAGASGFTGDDLTRAKFQSGFEYDVCSVPNAQEIFGVGSTLVNGGSFTGINIDEPNNGPLDTICFWWGWSSRTIEISDIDYRRKE